MIEFLDYTALIILEYVRYFLLPYTLVIMCLYAWYGIILYCFYRTRKNKKIEIIKVTKKIIKAAAYIYIIPAVIVLILMSANPLVIFYFDELATVVKGEISIYINKPLLLIPILIITILVTIWNKLKDEKVKTFSDVKKKKILCLKTEDALLVFASFPITIIMFFLFNLIHSTLSLFVILVFFFLIGVLIFSL